MRLQLPGLDTIGWFNRYSAVNEEQNTRSGKDAFGCTGPLGFPKDRTTAQVGRPQPTRSQQVNDSLLTRYQSLTSIQSPRHSSSSSPLSSHHWFVTPSYQKRHNQVTKPRLARSRPGCINSEADARLCRFADSHRNLGPPVKPRPHEYALRTTNHPLRPSFALAIRDFPSMTTGASTLVRDGTVLHFSYCQCVG